MRREVILLVLGACSYNGPAFVAGDADVPPIDALDAPALDIDAPTLRDAAIDAAIDAPPVDALVCFGKDLIEICVNTPPTTAFTVNMPLVLDTSNPTSCTMTVAQANGESACVILASSVTINAALTARGTRPLVLVGASSVTVNATINVASTRALATPGAGANSVLCAKAGDGGDDSSGAGGGAGGSFGGVGGGGATGNNGSGGPGGAKAAATPPTIVRGGCIGGDGGNSAGGVGRSGGGAVYFISDGTITINGIINASGAGGNGGGSGAGGGGGGSGGLIGFDAPSIASSPSAIIFANGGGGGEGGGLTGGQAGFDVSSAIAAAQGGANNFNGGDGGDGSVDVVLDGGNGSTDSSAGGAGGGGAGVIRVFPSQNLAGIVSPPPT